MTDEDYSDVDAIFARLEAGESVPIEEIEAVLAAHGRAMPKTQDEAMPWEVIQMLGSEDGRRFVREAMQDWH